ncbi:MAG: hypothetical protein CW742_14690 [Methanoregula sp.]|nr:MAG: hypothetical protein CW742_14690 [Methanoregula sp.]
MRTEQALQECERRYQAIFENTLDGIIIFTIQGTITGANASACRMTGFLPGDLVGKRVADIFSNDDAKKYLTGILRVVETKEPDARAVTVPNRGGTSRVSIRFSPVLGVDGSVVSVVGLARDEPGRGFRAAPGRSQKD